MARKVPCGIWGTSFRSRGASRGCIFSTVQAAPVCPSRGPPLVARAARICISRAPIPTPINASCVQGVDSQPSTWHEALQEIPSIMRHHLGTHSSCSPGILSPSSQAGLQDRPFLVPMACHALPSSEDTAPASSSPPRPCSHSWDAFCIFHGLRWAHHTMDTCFCLLTPLDCTPRSAFSSLLLVLVSKFLSD